MLARPCQPPGRPSWTTAPFPLVVPLVVSSGGQLLGSHLMNSRAWDLVEGAALEGLLRPNFSFSCPEVEKLETVFEGMS